MNYQCKRQDVGKNPIDDSTANLSQAVESLSDDELRELLLALLCEWRQRCSVSEALQS